MTYHRIILTKTTEAIAPATTLANRKLINLDRVKVRNKPLNVS